MPSMVPAAAAGGRGGEGGGAAGRGGRRIPTRWDGRSGRDREEERGAVGWEEGRAVMCLSPFFAGCLVGCMAAGPTAAGGWHTDFQTLIFFPGFVNGQMVNF